MILSIKGVDTLIPDGWHDVTWDMYVAAMGLSDTTDIAAALIGVDLSGMRPEHIALIVSRLSFWNEPIPPLADVDPIDIGLRSWEDMNSANKAFASTPSNHYAAGAEVVRIYYGIDISGDPVGYAMPFVTHLFDQFDSFGKRFEDLGKDVPDDNMIAAGIEKINAFGFFPTLDTLAGGRVLDYDLILQTPAITIYSRLLLDMVKRDYVNELNRINAFINRHGVSSDH